MGATDTKGWMGTTISTFPNSPRFAYTNSSQLTMNSMDIWSGASFQVAEDCNLTGCQIATQGISGSGYLYKFELWPLSASSQNTPDMSGTVLATSADFTTTSWFGIWEADFASAYAATAGQFLCVVLKPVSGIAPASCAIFNYRGAGMEKNSFPQAMKSTDGGSTWGVEYYGWPGIAIKTNLSYNLGGTCIMGAVTQNMYGTGDRVAQKITIPEADGATGIEIHCRGFYYTGYATSAGETINIGAWDVDGNDLVTPVTLDHEYLGYQLQYDSGGYFYFDGDLKMVSGGTYYIGWENTSTDVTQITCHRYGKTGADYTLAATPGSPERNWPGDGLDFETFQWDESAVSSAWTVVLSNYGGGRMCLNPLLSDIHGTHTPDAPATSTSAFNDSWIATYPGGEFAYTNDGPWSMSSDEHAIGTAFQVPEDMSLTHGNVVCEGVTGTSPFYKLQVWPMSTTTACTPDTSGTVLAETAAFQATYGYPSDLLHKAFTSPYSASAGDILCVIAVYADDGSTIDGSNYAKFVYTKGRQGQIIGIPALLYKYDPTWRAAYNSQYPSMTVTTDKDYDVGGIMSAQGLILNLAGDGDRGVIKWTIPEVSGRGLKYFVKGIKYAGYGPGPGDIFRCGVWNADGSILIRSPEMDGDKGGGTIQGSFGHYLAMGEMMFGGVAELISGTTYYLGIERITNMIQMSGHLLNGETDMFRSWPGGDQFKGSFWDASAGSPAWDDTMGSSYSPGRLMISPILSDIQGAASGGGGGSAKPSTTLTMGVFG